MSRIIRIMTADGSARAVFADTRNIVNEAAAIHCTSPTATAALGRVLTCASMMSSLLGEEDDVLTLRFCGNGPGGAVVATGDWKGNVRGFIQNPSADLPLRPDGKLDVGGLVGKGLVRVIRSAGGGEPYSGVNSIVSGEIAEDVAAYYAASEQIPTVCAAGVLVDRDYTCRSAGGALIQLMPFADPQVAEVLERNAADAPPISGVMADGTPEDAAEIYLKGLEYEIFDSFECGYVCNCGRERAENALLLLGREELEDMAKSPDGTSMGCQFCGRRYEFGREELLSLAERAGRKEK